MQALKRLLALSALLSLPAWAVAPASVTAVQAPAWLERAGRLRPLAVGMAIENGDRIRTGDDARAYLTLAEGSTVKLGAGSKLAFFSMSVKPRKEYRGALDVLTGAFRFTTDGLKRAVKSREVMVRVGAATAGIRGTDVWGRSDDREDLICLVEGKIDVWHAALPAPISMSEPMSFFVVPKGQAPKAVAPVSAEELGQWVRQTEIGRGAGASRAGGKVPVSLGIYKSEAEVLDQYDIARSAGFAVSIKPVAAEGGGWNYQLVATGFPDKEEAAAAAGRLEAATGIEAATRP
ncbi:MAG TPA: FecR family protein [Rhodocyclaceae bacterium]